MAELDRGESSSFHRASILIALSMPGVLAQLGYYLVDYEIAFAHLRDPVKAFVDTHFEYWLVFVFPSLVVFGICILFLCVEWTRSFATRDSSIRSIGWRTVYVFVQMLLFVVGLVVAPVVPMLFVMFQQVSLRGTVWSATIFYIVIALSVEAGSTVRHKSWLRPLAWGAAAGCVVHLLHLIWIDWDIDLTV